MCRWSALCLSQFKEFTFYLYGKNIFHILKYYVFGGINCNATELPAKWALEEEVHFTLKCK